MQRRSRRLIRALAAAAGTAMLLSALPASMAGAASGDAACKVHNLNQGTDRSSLQRAVNAADAGDALLIQGTCTGTTLIDKDLDLSYMGWAGAPMPLGSQYLTSPRGRIANNGQKPALVIDPGVGSFTVNGGLVVAGGIVIDEVSAWRDGSGSVPSAWRAAAPSTTASIPSASLSDCHLRNDASGAEFEQSQPAIDSAAPNDMLSLRGSCRGETVIDEASRMAGWRIAISSMVFGAESASADDSGPATLARVSVDDDVDSLILKDVRVTNGFRIRNLAP